MQHSNSEMFFQLIRLGLGTENIIEGNVASDCWLDTYSLAVRQGVGAFLFGGLQKAIGAGEIPADSVPTEVKMKLFAHTRQVEKHCITQFKTAAALADIYAMQGIRTVVLKGIAAGMNYPQPNYRPCGDLDCFLMGDYERGNVVAEQHGAKVERDFYKHSHIFYKGLMVENHQFCTSIRGSKRTKAFERLLQSLLRDEGTIKIGDANLECPSPMFNALFLTHHAYRHFLSEGIALRHLCDWAMLIHQQGNEVDWVSFNNYCELYGMKRFADTMTRLSAKLLHIDVPASYKIDKNDMLDDYLLHEILYGGSHAIVETGWKRRFSIIKDISNNRKRYKMFSDISLFRNILQLIYGFCFDREPRL